MLWFYQPRSPSKAKSRCELRLETLERYRFAFDRGKIDLIYLNLLETKANESEIKLVESQRHWFAALAQLQVALGLDPLDQAMTVSALPPSDMPGPGRLPKLQPPEPQALEKDWELHSKEFDSSAE